MENFEEPDQAGARGSGLKLAVGLVVLVTAPIAVWLFRGAGPFPKTETRPTSVGQAASPLFALQPAESSLEYLPTPVPTNRAGDVSRAFRGEIHPLLFGQTNLEVTAHWGKIGRGRDELDAVVPASVYELFTELKPATASRTYTERDFSRLLPESMGSVGQVWEVGADDVANLLRQFHPRPALHLISMGRRAGPDGAFGLLRAVSATHLDLLFRVHAEFDIAQSVWYTPACFWGRMLIDKQAGKVESFRLWLPTDQPLNVHLTVVESMPPGGTELATFRKILKGDMVVSKRDIVRVEQMELASANSELAEQLDWPDSIEMALARKELAKAFYAFESINWVPWKTAVTTARERHKPILAIVLWGALDDQSC